MMNKRLILEELDKVYSLTDRLCGTNLITESQEDKSQKKAIALLMQKRGLSKEDANEFIRKELREYVTALRSKRGGKFTLGVTRIAIENWGRLTTDNVMELNNALSCIIDTDELYDKYDQNLNNESIDNLVDATESRIIDKQEWIKKGIERIKGSLRPNTKYKIKKIDTYEQAKGYGYGINDCRQKITPWCVCTSDYTFNSYTKGGIKQFYFCLRDGFEQMDEKDPDYQMSAIAVLVGPDGFLDPADGVFDRYDINLTDHVNEIELSKLLGVDFFEVFKPANQIA